MDTEQVSGAGIFPTVSHMISIRGLRQHFYAYSALKSLWNRSFSHRQDLKSGRHYPDEIQSCNKAGVHSVVVHEIPKCCHRTKRSPPSSPESLYSTVGISFFTIESAAMQPFEPLNVSPLCCVNTLKIIFHPFLTR